jgi:hypothetical protein
MPITSTKCEKHDANIMPVKIMQTKCEKHDANIMQTKSEKHDAPKKTDAKNAWANLMTKMKTDAPKGALRKKKGGIIKKVQEETKGYMMTKVGLVYKHENGEITRNVTGCDEI